MRDPQRQISGLLQKVSVVADNLAITWSGDRIGAAIVRTALAEASMRAPLSLNDIPEVFQTIVNNLASCEVTIVGFVQHRERSGTFGFNCDSNQHSVFGNVRLSGTGCTTIQKYIDQFHGNRMTEEGDANLLERTLGHGLLIAGALLSEEYSTLETLESHFGGGYELCTFVHDRFFKVDDITYIWWIASRAGNRIKVSQPLRVLKLKYVGSSLIVRSLSLDRSQGESSFDDRHHFIPPLEGASLSIRNRPYQPPDPG